MDTTNAALRIPCDAIAKPGTPVRAEGRIIEILLRLLGPFAVRTDGAEVEPSAFGGRLAQTLLRLLATRRGAAVPRDVLAEALWPAHHPADPAANLNVLASRIRKATGAPWLVKASAGGYLMPVTESCVVDSERFLAEVDEGARLLACGKRQLALRTWQAALARWNGEPLAEDLYADWAQPYRRLLHQQRLVALEGAATAALETGSPLVALPLAEQAVSADPLRESANLLRVRALAAAGDPAGAAQAFSAFRRTLAEDTGLEPSPAARDLHQRLLRGELTSPPAGYRPRPAHPDVAVDDVPFVGRDRELATVLEHIAGSDATHIIVLAGVSGAGKTRLLAEVATRAGRPVLRVRAYRAERDEAWSFARHLLTEVLAMDVANADALPARMLFALADLLPELEDIRPVPSLTLEPESRRALVVEGALRLLGSCGPQPVLLADDVQWVDASSMSLLARIGERLADVRMVLAYRPDEIGEESPLQAMLDELRHVRLGVGPLPADAIAGLVADRDLAAALTEHTDRTPMAVLEVVRTLGRRGLVTRRDDRRWSASGPDAAGLALDLARAGQRRAVTRRAAGQLGHARELLRMLALLGRSTPARVLADALGVAQPVVLGGLDELAKAGLARLDDRGWATAHDMVAETIIDGLRPATRGALHGILARALAADDADRAEVARHLAGAGDTDAAAQAYAAAAEQALERFANAEARRLATAGLAQEPKAALRATLLETRAEAHARSGNLTAAADDLRNALRAGVTRPVRARLLARHARLATGTEDLVHAGELVQLALAETAGEPQARATALYAGAIIDMNTDRPDRAQRRWDEALVLFEQVGNTRGVADILDARAMATCLGGRNREAIAQFGRVAQLFTDAGDLFRVVTPRSTRGHGLVFLGEPVAALAETERALDLARSLDYPDGVTYALWHRSEALSTLGRADEAEASAREAIEVAQRLHHRSWTASAHRALGIALQARGQLTRAEEAFGRSLELAEHWPLFASWACARIGLVRIARGDLDGAATYVSRALAQGPPLAHYEGRLARAELVHARSEPGATDIVRDALTRAKAGGHLVDAARLAELEASALQQQSRS